MKSHLKDLAHSAANVTHHLVDEIVHVAHDITQNIANITRSSGDKIEHILKEKGIAVTREKRHGRECHNIVANSDGTFFTNNSIDFARGLLNQVLFSDGGEERMSGAMSDQKLSLEKVQNPQQKVTATKAFQLFSKNETN
ncbi:MAG: hypothetical protein KA100_03980 [Rickettsiales bacterium]|nr:hypothetical protein [Rickettsiales bacterium]